jgi:hypothetical protein
LCSDKKVVFVGSRVTRLGEFLTIGHFLKITEVDEFFVLLLPMVKVMYKFWQKWFWLNLGDFFHRLIWSPGLAGKRTEENEFHPRV